MVRGFIRRALGIETRAGFDDIEELIRAANATASGIAVSGEKALECPIVLACCRVLAESVGQLPLILYRRRSDGGKDRAVDHPLYPLLHDGPNAWTGSAEFRTGMMFAALLARDGTAYAFIGRARDEVAEIVQAPRNAIAVRSDQASGEPIFSATMPDGTQRPVPREELFRLRVPGPDPIKGLGIVHQARESIALAMQLESYAARLFKRGARPSASLEIAGRLNEQAMQRVKARLESLHSGEANAGTIVLEEGMKFAPLQFSSVDLQYIELYRHMIAQIARAFRVPLHMIQELERTTHSNAEAMGQQFLSTVLLPWLKLWEQSIRRDLLTDEERRQYFVEFLVDDLVRADIAARFDALFKAVGRPWLTVDEARAIENRAAVAGGDVLFAPMNTAPVEGAADARVA